MKSGLLKIAIYGWCHTKKAKIISKPLLSLSRSKKFQNLVFEVILNNHILHYYCPIFRALCNALMQRVTTFWGFAFPGKERMERRLVYIGSSSPWNIIHHMVVVLKVFQIVQKKKIKKITQDHYCWCWKKKLSHDHSWSWVIRNDCWSHDQTTPCTI